MGTQATNVLKIFPENMNLSNNMSYQTNFDYFVQITKRPIVSEGKPGEAIVEAAKKENVSLIVMGSRGLNTLRRTFMGSVSDYVLHHVHVPVMIVPPAHE